MIRSWLKRLRDLVESKTHSVEVNSNQDPAGSTPLDEHDFTFSRLNQAAALRQASIGKGYARSSESKPRLAELQQGTVTLPPHEPWTGDYTDWAADPFKDRNWRFQYHTLRWINPYLWDALDGNEDSKTEWKRIVHSWGEANTPPERAEDEFAWMDMTDGNRAIQLSLGASLVDHDDSWYMDLLAVHRNWLLDDDNIVVGNHGLHQNLGLFVVAAVLNDEVGMDKAIQRLGKSILEAFDEKGLNEEGSVGYHQLNLAWWQQAQLRVSLENHALPEEAATRLEKAGQTLAFLLMPDGALPQIGDGNRGNGRRTLHPLIKQVIRGKVVEPELPLLHHYRNGFTIFRSGWGTARPLKQESHTIIRHGQDLLRHSHDDRGSVHIYSAGRLWIADGGFHSYQSRDPDRAYTKSRAAHSLVDLPEVEHDPRGDVKVVSLEDAQNVQSIEVLDDNFSSAVWRRRVIYVPIHNTWIIWDRISSDVPTNVQQQWLIDLGLDVEQHNKHTVRLTDQKQSMYMRWLADPPKLDVAVGQPGTESKRGLIGVRWKEMKPTRSIHALFASNTTESVVVLSHDPELDFDLTERIRHESFTLRGSGQNGTFQLYCDAERTLLN